MNLKTNCQRTSKTKANMKNIPTILLIALLLFSFKGKPENKTYSYRTFSYDRVMSEKRLNYQGSQGYKLVSANNVDGHWIYVFVKEN